MYYTGRCSFLDPRTLLPFQICEIRLGFFPSYSFIYSFFFLCLNPLHFSELLFFSGMSFHFIIFQSPELCNIIAIILLLNNSFVKNPLLFSMHYIACTVVTRTVFYLKYHCHHSKTITIKCHQNLAFLQFILPHNSSRVYCLLPWYQHQIFVILLCPLTLHNLVIPMLCILNSCEHSAPCSCACFTLQMQYVVPYSACCWTDGNTVFPPSSSFPIY